MSLKDEILNSPAFADRMQQPHEYAPNCNPSYPGTCWGCGKPKEDLIHVVVEAGPT